MTEVEFDIMVAEYVTQWGALSADEAIHLTSKRNQIAALREAAEQDRQSAADAQALKDRYDEVKKAKAAEQAAALKKYRADRAAKQAEREKARAKTILNKMVKTGGPVQGLGGMANNYSGDDLVRLIGVSTTPIARYADESDDDYRASLGGKTSLRKGQADPRRPQGRHLAQVLLGAGPG